MSSGRSFKEGLTIKIEGNFVVFSYSHWFDISTGEYECWQAFFPLDAYRRIIRLLEAGKVSEITLQGEASVLTIKKKANSNFEFLVTIETGNIIYSTEKYLSDLNI